MHIPTVNMTASLQEILGATIRSSEERSKRDQQRSRALGLMVEARCNAKGTGVFGQY